MMKMNGGKTKKARKPNNVFKDWVKFIKKVQHEEKLPSYRDAMRRAKIRSDKGEKWKSMKGGDGEEEAPTDNSSIVEPTEELSVGSFVQEEEKLVKGGKMKGGIILGGKRRRTMRKSRRKGKGKSRRRR
jgi:hypothetical protein